MSSCVNDVCGTGGWSGPKPGDPDNNLVLNATTVYGGIAVSWTYPMTNPHAVAFTALYRATSNDFTTAIKQGEFAGTRYLDPLNPTQDTEYYYWIQMVTVNGTVQGLIGPASAVARPRKEQTLEDLTGLIDEGVLAQTLKTSIAGITLNHGAIIQEIQDRLAANAALQTALDAVQSDLGEALTYVLNETTARTTADSAMVNQINAIAAGVGENAAAIVEERNVRVTKDLAVAQDLLTIYGRVDAADGAIIAEKNLRVAADNVLIQDIFTMYGNINNSNAAITDIKNLNISPTSALATKLTNLTTSVGDASSAVQTLSTSLSNGTHALASKVTTVEAAINGNVATGQVGLYAEVDAITGAIGSMYVAKVEVNGLIGGFGIHNSGILVDAGFDVDRFWVGRTNSDKVKPFIIDNDIVYINKARIRDADIDTLKIQGNAVTVPTTSSAGIYYGTGNTYRVINSAVITMSEPGFIYAHCLAAQWFPNGAKDWHMTLGIAGIQGMTIGGNAIDVAPAVTHSTWVNAGTYLVQVYWQAPTDMYISESQLFVMGTKR